MGSLGSTGIGLYDMAGNVREILAGSMWEVFQCSNCREFTNVIGRAWYQSASYVPFDAFQGEAWSSRNWLGFRVVRVP